MRNFNLIKFLTVCLILALCLGCENKVETAKKLWQENKYDQAMSKLKEEIAKNSDNKDAQKLLIDYQIRLDQQNLEKVAPDSIRKHSHYPKNVFNTFYDIPQNSLLGQEVMRLIKEGYLAPSREGFIAEGGYKATEKGKGIVEQAYYNGFYRNFFVSIATHIEDIKKITEVLVDSKNGEALVKFEIGFTPTDYFNRIAMIDQSYFTNFNNQGSYNRVLSGKIDFKKWDNGWRIKEH